jgi:hypothetical protein
VNHVAFRAVVREGRAGFMVQRLAQFPGVDPSTRPKANGSSSSELRHQPDVHARCRRQGRDG